MKTQKIVINGKEKNSLIVVEVPASIVDVGSEFVTFVHRDARYYDFTPTSQFDTNKFNKNYSKWTVSEQRTGTGIATASTRAGAVIEATIKIKNVGKDGMRVAIERQFAYLTSKNIRLI